MCGPRLLNKTDLSIQEIRVVSDDDVEGKAGRGGGSGSQNGVGGAHNGVGDDNEMTPLKKSDSMTNGIALENGNVKI